MNLMKRSVVAAVLIAAILLVSITLGVLLSQPKPATAQPTLQYSYTIVNTYPHDPEAFTEGLLYSDGVLYESTGLNGESSLRRVNLTSGEVLQEISMPNQYFGEGMAIVNDKIIQLTYLNKIGFIYDKTTFQLLGNFSYSTQGWGLTYNGNELIMSDGSDILYFLNPQTYQITKQVHVYDGNSSINKLNELEYVKGDLYANIFEKSKIAIINPDTGQVKGWIDLNNLGNQNYVDTYTVMNGIAYDAQNNRLFVTGKDWAHLYEITLVPAK